MRIEYTDLNIYCERKNITYEEFGGMTGIPTTTAHRAITGTGMPGKKTRRKLDAFIATHAAEIEAAIK